MHGKDSTSRLLTGSELYLSADLSFWCESCCIDFEMSLVPDFVCSVPFRSLLVSLKDQLYCIVLYCIVLLLIVSKRLDIFFHRNFL